MSGMWDHRTLKISKQKLTRIFLERTPPRVPLRNGEPSRRPGSTSSVHISRLGLRPVIMKYLLAFLAILYVLIPYDILPDFAVGWGWIDDIVVLWLLWKFFNAQKKKAGPGSYYGRQAFEDQQNKRYAGNETRAEAPFDETTGPKDPYTVLNIDRNASPEDIKQAFRELAGKYHPDKVQHLGEEFRRLAEERFKEIEEAYRELKPK